METGQKNGRLLFIKKIYKKSTPSGNFRNFGLFLCDCGKQKEICISNVKRGVTKSCGCISAEQLRKIAQTKGKLKSSFKHGFFGTRFYNIWASAKSRCENKNSTSYRFYGAVGIKFNYKDFSDFKDDLYESYLQHVDKYGEKETTLERINSKKDYEKGNCRWATYLEQGRNRKGNRLITIDGVTLTLSEWVSKKKTTAWYILKCVK